jgi:hypothetical protein
MNEWMNILALTCLHDYMICKHFFYLDGLESLACSNSELLLKKWISETVGRTVWAGDHACRKAATCTGQHKNKNNEAKYPCLEWDSSPRSQFLEPEKTFHTLNSADSDIRPLFSFPRRKFELFNYDFISCAFVSLNSEFYFCFFLTFVFLRRLYGLF